MILYKNESHSIIGIFNSSNSKTGPLVQTWILENESGNGGFCEDCTSDKLCYVFRGKKAVQTKFKEGRYEEIQVNLEKKRVRLGAYGDPCVFPLSVWKDELKVKKHTGYTHQWRKPHAQEYKSFVLASVEDLESYHLAKSLGWKVFYNLLDVYLGDISLDQVLQETNMIECPNSTQDLTCFECMLCDGAKKSKDIYIHPHGNRLSKKNARRTLDRSKEQNEELIKSWLLDRSIFELSI